MFNNFRRKWQSAVKRMKARPWQFGTIPVMAAAVGYVTNYIGVQMLFYPLEWTGVPIRRWEGQVQYNI